MNKSRLSFLVLLVMLVLTVAAGCGSRATHDTGSQKSVANSTTTGEKTRVTSPSWAEDSTGQKSGDTPAQDAGVPEVRILASPQTASTRVADKSRDPQALADKGTLVDGSPGETADAAATSVKLLVTRDFGNTTLLEKRAPLKKGWTALDILHSNAEVKTAYSGGLVTGINGVESRSGGLSSPRHDWFYFVNGICADIGASDYELQPGESVWWDYHPWDNTGLMNSAVIGSYPEPFLHGYRGRVKTTIVLSPANTLELAASLQAALRAKGVASVCIRELNENLLAERAGPTIVVGEWKDLEKFSWLAHLNQGYKRNGTNVHFTGDSVELLDYRGQPRRNFTENTGVIAATGEGLGDDSPLWLVAGVDRKGLEGAVAVLARDPEKVCGMYSAAIISGKAISLPL